MDHAMDQAPEGMQLAVTGAVFSWRGPSPHHFVALSSDDAAFVADVATAVTYGWGMVPVTARIGSTVFTTSLYPKDGGYLVPLKDAVRSAEGIDLDDVVVVELTIGPPR